MTTLLHILTHNVIPLTIMIGLGMLLQRAFKLDIKTLSKLNFYLFSPGVAFVMLYNSSLSFEVILEVLLFFSIFFIALIVVVEIVVRLRRYRPGMRSAMRNSVLFYNSANYAIPLNQLVFVNDPFTLSIQIIIMMMQNLIPNTYGVYSVNAHKQTLRQTLRTIASLPTIYVIPFVILLRVFDIPVPEPIWIPLNYIASGFIVTALVTLGVQLGSMNWSLRLADVLLSNALRLCVSPLLGFLVVLLLGIQGTTAQALVLSCAVPTSLSSVLLAVEFDNEPEFASQVVFASTLFSVFTVTIVIYLLQYVG
ncbi:AEC family transporter [Paenibacillus thermoaerophilus]|uniref:AEC family transporter n=1 Tax=Paenibacillus thermoaerophilus TaxID=1215385 RepID=A0ABW2V5M2_9BACL|nr:AEC family transporter [Paenibacillus thermoaerophilus]TMV18433.1 AEC family transporter [Paenibacillus thermoaerophilus]